MREVSLQGVCQRFSFTSISFSLIVSSVVVAMREEQWKSAVGATRTREAGRGIAVY